MPTDEEIGFPADHPDERESLLTWLGYLRGAVVRKASDISDTEAHRRPDGKLISLVGIVNHLAHVEWRWIDGGFLDETVERLESEFTPGPELTITEALGRYRERAQQTDRVVRELPLETRCRREKATTLRWVLLHLINETARHAGHADATRELLDGTTGE